MKRNQFLIANFICLLIFLSTACKKEDTSGVSDSIYGTYQGHEGGQICGSSGCTPNLSIVTIKAAPINTALIKLTVNGVIYDSVNLNANRSFSIDPRPNLYMVYGSGNFGFKTISLEIRNSSSSLLNKYDNIPKLNDRYE